MKYNFVYKTTNNLNGDYYYGVHSTDNLDDGYMGSGKRIKRSINKYGKENFTREIVQFFSSEKCAYRLEAAIVTPELISDKHCLNIAEGGFGGNVIEGLTEEERTRVRKKQSLAKQSFIPWNKGIPCREETKEKLREANLGKHENKKWVNKNGEQQFISQSELELFLNNGWSIGRGQMPEEQKQKMSISQKGKKHGPMSEEHKQKLRKPKTEEHKQKLREANLGKHWYTNGEQEICCDDKDKPEGWIRGRQSCTKTKWINDGKICKHVKEDKLSLFLNNGWQIGRIKIK